MNLRRHFKRHLSFLQHGWKGKHASRWKKLATISLLTAQVLLSACSIQTEKTVPARPILPTMERMSRAGEDGVWMSAADAANLALWVTEVERLCR